jgi:hypothetical protein
MTMTNQVSRCFWCGHLSSEFKTKGLWVAGKWHCPRCVKRLANRRENLTAYRSECYTCPQYRVNMFGGLSLDGEPENPRFICLKFEAKQNCVFDEPEPVRIVRTAPASARTPTVTPLAAAAGPEPKLPSSLPPRTEPITLIPPASALPNKPELKSPAPKLRYPPRRERRQK